MTLRIDADAATIDARILEAIRRWHLSGEGLPDAEFDSLAIDIFRYQIARNEPYRRFVAALGRDETSAPNTWREIPAVPSSAFKVSTLASFDVRFAECRFRTSGTTFGVTNAGRSGWHFVERATLYDASLTAGFDRFMLADTPAPRALPLRFLNLVPDPRERSDSSLGYMVGELSVLRGDGRAGWFFQESSGELKVDVDGFCAAMEHAIGEHRAVCVSGTAFAFVALLERLEADLRHFHAMPGSRIMETGGFKGRTRAVPREELYARLEGRLGVPQSSIVAEYGMTELLSQYYDAPESRDSALRVKVGPPWLRTLIVDAQGDEVQDGEAGFLRHVDLANRSSVIAIDTEDRGYRRGEGFVLLGRDPGASLRGCSLDAEDLIAQR